MKLYTTKKFWNGDKFMKIPVNNEIKMLTLGAFKLHIITINEAHIILWFILLAALISRVKEREETERASQRR